MSELGLPRAQLLLLGGFRLDLDGPLEASRAVKRLVAYLAVRGGSAHRAALRTDLWPDNDGPHASAALRSTLWRAPRPGGRSLVHSDGERVWLEPTVEVDLWRSTAHAYRLAAGTDLEAEPAYQPFADELLPDWSDDWLALEQESYRQLRLHALEQVSSRLREREHYSAALRAALLAVQGEPLRESAHRHVMAIHLAEGNPAEALRQFHACRRLLAAELGLPPSPATRAVVAHLLGRPVDGR